jgi:hypothetical protein
VLQVPESEHVEGRFDDLQHRVEAVGQLLQSLEELAGLCGQVVEILPQDACRPAPDPHTLTVTVVYILTHLLICTVLSLTHHIFWIFFYVRL